MVPPVPIPNTAVKHINAESTCLETGREDRKLPVEKGKAFTVVDAFFVYLFHEFMKRTVYPQYPQTEQHILWITMIYACILWINMLGWTRYVEEYNQHTLLLTGKR